MSEIKEQLDGILTDTMQARRSGSNETRRPDPVSKLQRAYYEGLETNAWRKGAGLDDAPKQSSGDGAILLKITEKLIEGADRRAEYAEKEKDEIAKRFWDAEKTKLEEQVSAIKNSQGQSPFAQVEQAMSFFDKMRQYMTPTDAAAAPGLDPGTYLKGKEIELSIHQMKMQHELAMEQMKQDAAERRLRFDFELKRWQDERDDQRQRHEYEARMKEQQQSDNRDMKKHALDEITAIGQAIAGGLDMPGTFSSKRNSQRPVESRTTREHPEDLDNESQHVEERPSSVTIKCPSCEEPLQIQRGQVEVECGECREIHHVNWGTKEGVA